MRGYLLDTNQLTLAVRNESPMFDRIIFERRRGFRIGTCVPVLCEAEAGGRNVADPDTYRTGLGTLLRKVRVWPLTIETSQRFGEIYVDLRRRGRVLSHVDIVLAALCQELGVSLVTKDKDFAALPWLKTENWA
jgi:predicted nucleic acid-binding protein